MLGTVLIVILFCCWSVRCRRGHTQAAGATIPAADSGVILIIVLVLVLVGRI